MNQFDEYLHFIWEHFDTSSEKLTHDTFYDWDEGYYEEEFPSHSLVTCFFTNYRLTTLEKFADFLEEKFEGELLTDMFSAYFNMFPRHIINGISSLSDLKKLDKRFGTEFYDYFTANNLYQMISSKYEDYITHLYTDFADDLDIINKLEPDANHIAKFLVYILDHRDKKDHSLIHEHMMNFMQMFDTDKILAEDILKNYCEEHNLMEEYGIFDEDRGPRP